MPFFKRMRESREFSNSVLALHDVVEAIFERDASWLSNGPLHPIILKVSPSDR